MIGRVSTIFVFVALLLATVPTHAHEKFRFVGPITKIDWSKNELTMTAVVAGREMELEIEVLTKVPVTKDGKKVPRSTLKPGLYIVMDALGDDYFDLESTAIKIVPKPAK
jgi:hypothetical protein